MASRLIELGFEDVAKATLNLKYTIQQKGGSIAAFYYLNLRTKKNNLFFKILVEY